MKQDPWEANFQAVQDAKAAIVAAKHTWTEALKERSRLLKPLLVKQRFGELDDADRALIAEQDDKVRALGEAARATRADLEVARQRFKDAEGCK